MKSVNGSKRILITAIRVVYLTRIIFATIPKRIEYCSVQTIRIGVVAGLKYRKNLGTTTDTIFVLYEAINAGSRRNWSRTLSYGSNLSK